jgi:hypothetical protein
MTFLYPTESRFLSSTVSSTSSFATFFMASTISVELNIPKKKDQQDAEREEVEATKDTLKKRGHKLLDQPRDLQRI